MTAQIKLAPFNDQVARTAEYMLSIAVSRGISVRSLPARLRILLGLEMKRTAVLCIAGANEEMIIMEATVSRYS